MARQIRWIAVLVATLLAGSLSAGTWLEQQIASDGEIDRYYRAYVPDDSSPGMPLVLLLHGGGGDYTLTDSGPDAEWVELADLHRFLLIAPNGYSPESGQADGDDQHWNDCRGDIEINLSTQDDIFFFNELLDWAIGAYQIDTQRVYVTGGSNGGMMSFRAAFEMGDRVAAIAAFIANLPAGDECATPVNITPTAIINGDAEELYMPWDGGCIFAADCSRGLVVSAEATRDFWLAHNRIDAPDPEITEFPDIIPGDDSTVVRTVYEGGLQGSTVAFYRVRNGGHNKPSIEHPYNPLALLLAGLGIQNRDMESARQAWNFLSEHTLDGAPPASSNPGGSAYLRIDKGTGGDLLLDWTSDCGAGNHYGIYRGDLTLGYDSAAPIPGLCDLPATSASVTPSATAAEFYLVVPNTGTSEGDYGSASSGKRPAATAACYPQNQLDSCADGL